MVWSSVPIRYVLIITSLLCLPAAMADEPDPSNGALELPSEDALSRGRYSLRQKATLEMWRHREQSREQVQRAARHPDPEVAGRAKWVLRQWRRGAVPGMPPKISRLLHSDDPAATEELLEYGQFRAAVVAVEESGGAVGLESIQERISNALVRRFPLYVATALKDGTLDDLLRLVDLVATTGELAVCRVQLMQHLALPIDDSTLLPSAAETWSEADRVQATVLVLFTLGRVEEAVNRARESRDDELLLLARMMSGRWDEIAKDAIAAADTADAESPEQVAHYSNAMVAADRSNNRELFASTVEKLRANELHGDESRAGGAGDEISFDLRWQTLAMHGEVEAAIDVLKQRSPEVAGEIALASARAARATQVLGYPLEEVDEKLDEWIEEAIEAERKKSDGADNKPAERLLMFMRVMIRVGRFDVAREIASGLSAPLGNLPKRSTGPLRQRISLNTSLRDLVLYHLVLASKYDWVVEFAVQPGETVISSRAEGYLRYALPDLEVTTFKILMDAMAYLMPSASFRDRFRVVCDLVSGEVPEAFEQPEMFGRLYDRLTTGKRQIQRIAGRVVVSPRMQLNKDIVALFARHGQAELANRCLQDLSRGSDAESSLELAEGELNRGRSEKAAEYLELLWRQVEGKSPDDRNLSADAGYAVKALICNWIIAQRQADDDLSEQYLRQLKVTLCSPSTEMRHEIAQYLVQWGHSDLAEEVYQVLLPMTAFGSREATEFYDVARSYAMLMRDERPNEAAGWFDLAVVGTLQSPLGNRPFVTLPLYVSRIAVDGAVKSANEAKTRRFINRVLQLDPIDIDFAERLLPKVREAGMQELATETLDRILDQGKLHMQSFPADATVSNNLAWASAMNKHRLDEALELSERAVYLEPDSAIYRDTLAEVLFLLGRITEALQIEQHCLLDDPDQWHLHQQIKKYQELLSE